MIYDGETGEMISAEDYHKRQEGKTMDEIDEDYDDEEEDEEEDEEGLDVD